MLISNSGGMVVQKVALLHLTDKVAGSNHGRGPFWVKFTCSLCECSGSLQALLFPLTDKKHACSANWQLNYP